MKIEAFCLSKLLDLAWSLKKLKALDEFVLEVEFRALIKFYINQITVTDGYFFQVGSPIIWVLRRFFFFFGGLYFSSWPLMVGAQVQVWYLNFFTVCSYVLASNARFLWDTEEEEEDEENQHGTEHSYPPHVFLGASHHSPVTAAS